MLVTHPTGAGTTGYQYLDAARTVTTTRSQNSCGQPDAIVSSMIYDGLGRQVQTVLQAGSSPSVLTSRSYDALGRLYQASAPYLSGGTPCFTTYSYDALGRVTEERTCDNAATGSYYQGNAVTVTDPAGKQRQLVTDALGRLTKVEEVPSGPPQPTAYGYDALDNLKLVCQGGTIVGGVCQNGLKREFTYDWLGRLTSAANPEMGPEGSPSGTINYTYDLNGNLQTRSDARGVVTTYGNDQLNRVFSKAYSDGTPTVTYSYDTCSKGRLCAVTSSVSSTTFGYDAAGRVNTSSQVTGGQTYTFGYTYNLAGGLETVTYPSKTAAPSSGLGVRTCYDAAGRPSQATNVATSAAYASGVQYAPHGAVKQMTLGSGVVETTGFNSRSQPRSIQAPGVLDLTLGYCDTIGTADCGSNNGNVRQQQVDSKLTSYGYDALNRIISASGTEASQSYAYDARGNRALTWDSRGLPVDVPTAVSHYDGRNRLNKSVFASVLYDSAGNLTRTPDGQQMAYDAENRMTSFIGGQAVSYAYDGEGRRVKKVAPSGTTVYVYDAFGNLAAEYATVPENWSGTQYLVADHLGSIRRVVGAHPSQRDFLPFGEEVAPTDDDPPLKFTGKERDTESGLDYFGARYYSPEQGRFTSADEPLADQQESNPQSWNLYAYARNNPLRYIDPSGGSCLNSVGQVTEDGPAGSGPVGDNGDGKGCAAVGVKPSTKEQRERGEDITPQEMDVHADPQLDPLVATALHQAGVRADAGLSAGLSIMATNAGGIIAGRLIGLGAEALLAARAARIAAADAAEISNLLSKAASGVGGQGARASSSRAALAAAEEWVGQGARPIVDRATGQFVGKISADGSKVYRVTSMGKAQPYVNLVNRTTGGNLHVRF